ncbi:MAG TPA: hypothetical protein VNY30_14165 [Bryobacteraceae bacterium]|nr:hypothetical protein [Bryobacteraceae bacterium]
MKTGVEVSARSAAPNRASLSGQSAQQAENGARAGVAAQGVQPHGTALGAHAVTRYDA